MKRTERTILIISMILAFLLPVSLPGLQAGEEAPLWLKLEEARNALRDRELGTALQIYREILGDAEENGKTVPEAEMGLGYIFEQEGELELARVQYQRALDHADGLYVPEDRFTILYRLAGIYSRSLQYGRYEQTLRTILALGSGTSGGPDSQALAYQEAMYTVLLRNGPDKLFTLYRKDERNIQRAYGELGLYCYRTGLYREAVRNLIPSLVTPLTNAVSYRRDRDFEYEYTRLDRFIGESFGDPFLANYLAETDFLKNLYYLGASLYASGYQTLAREIWTALLAGPAADPWRDRAVRQLNEPFVEPLLTPQNWD